MTDFFTDEDFPNPDPFSDEEFETTPKWVDEKLLPSIKEVSVSIQPANSFLSGISETLKSIESKPTDYSIMQKASDQIIGKLQAIESKIQTKQPDIVVKPPEVVVNVPEQKKPNKWKFTVDKSSGSTEIIAEAI